MSKHAWSALVVMVFGVSRAPAQIKLEWQFKEGATFFVERVATHKQSVQVKGKLLKEERTKTWLTAVTVKKRIGSDYVLAVKIEAIRFHHPLGPPVPMAKNGQALGWDDALALKIAGSAFTATVTAQGKVLRLEGYEAFITKLADKNIEQEMALRALLSEKAVRADVEDIFDFLPDKPVHKGDKWQRDAIEPLPPFGSFKGTLAYVMEEAKGDEAVIGCKIKRAYQPPSGAGDFFRVSKGGLQADEGAGQIVFDWKKGRLVSGEKTMRVRGELLVEALGKETQLEFTAEQRWRVRVYGQDDAKGQ